MKKRKERIAILLSSPSFESFYGGGMGLTCEQYLSSYRNDFSFTYAFALAELEIDVIIYMPAWYCRGLHQIDERVFVRFLPLSLWYWFWHRIPLISRTKYGRYIASYANAKAFAKPLHRSLSDDGVGALYIQEYWTARFDYLVRTLAIPVIGADHGGRRNRQLTFAKRGSFKRALAVTCQSEDECSEVRAFGCEPVFLTNGVDTSFWSPSQDVERAQTILIVARLTDRQKRISDLIRAMQYLPEPWFLEIAGTGPDEAVLRELSQKLGMAHRVTFLGFVTDKRALRDLYRRCGVYCMPSRNEAVALAALEAMSCGCPIVVTSIRAFEKLVKDSETGFKVPVEDPKELARAITRAWERRDELGAAARQMVQDSYSMKVTAIRLRDLMRSARADAG